MDANGMPCRRGLPRETDRAPLTVLQACELKGRPCTKPLRSVDV
ncbi:MAG: hypothetical protein QOG83_73 [Alphaproteobacteria bacterium]|jgi:hypothetical protein|nr:hypothetical protein [Alphaproteobacteria bacterium]